MKAPFDIQAVLFLFFREVFFKKYPTPQKTFTGKVFPDEILNRLLPPNGGSTPILVANRRNDTPASS
jgi:hypothetical protein